MSEGPLGGGFPTSTRRREQEKFNVMNASIALALTLLAVASGMTVKPRQGKAAEFTSSEKVAMATFASTECIIATIACIYDPAHTTEDMAAEVGRACDTQAVELGRARAAAGIDRGSPPSDHDMRLAAQKMAVFLIGQVRDSARPRQASGS